MTGAGPACGFWDSRLWLLLPPLLLLTALGQAPLFDVDEGAFAQATREMFQRGDFLSTWLDGRPRYDKPILIYWLMAGASLLFGVSEWVFRLPSALAGYAWAWAVWGFVRPRFGSQPAVLAMLMIATMLGPWAIGRAATADALLNLLLALTLFDMWRHWESGSPAALRRSFVWIGLGVLTKGPVAILIPLAASGLFAFSIGAWRRWLGCIVDPLGWLLLLVIVLPWYGWALWVHGWAFVEGFILHHNVERFTGTLHGHAGSLFYYALVLPLLLLPWTGLLPAVLGRLRRLWAEPLARLLLLWAGFVLVFFSLSGTKLPHYVLYGLTPLVLLMAREAERAGPFLALLPALVLLALVAAAPVVLAQLAERGVGHAYYDAQLQAMAEIELGRPLLLGTLAVLAGLVLAGIGRLTVQLRLIASALLATSVLASVTTPLLGELLQGPVKAAGLYAAQHGPQTVWAWRIRAPSFSVYRGRPTPDLSSAQAGDWVLLRSDRPLPALQRTVFASGGIRLVELLEPFSVGQGGLPDGAAEG